MKKGLLGIKLQHSFLLFLIVIFSPFFSFSQQSACEQTAYPALCNRPSGAYKTIGPSDIEFRNWNSEGVWNKLKGNDRQYPVPPSITSSNNTYIEISQGHKIKLNEPFAFGNSLTLVICGELEVGSIIEMPVVVTQTIDGCNTSSSEEFTFNGLLPGFPSFDGLATLLGVGFEVSLWNPNLSGLIENSIIVQIPAALTVIEDVETGNFSITKSLEELSTLLNASGLSCDKFGSSYAISIRAFASFSLAGGTLVRTAFGPYENYGATLNEGTLEVLNKDLNFVNSLTLIICPTGKLIMDKLEVKNVASLEVNGVFVVNQILGNNPQNNCIFSTSEPPGVIITPQGTAPYITPDGFSFGGAATGNNQCIAQGAVILPIELLSFTPEIKPDRIKLNWTTGTEINNDYFTLERSRDMYGWEVLGFVPGAGNSSVPLSYSFSDLRPLDGLAYYRLKQTDFDGKFKYYGPIAAHYDLGMEGLDFKVLKQYTNWVIAVPNDGVYQVEVYNLMGHRLVSEKIENTITIPAPEGAVVIRVTDGFARSASRVVM